MDKNITDKIVTNIGKTEIGKPILGGGPQPDCGPPITVEIESKPSGGGGGGGGPSIDTREKIDTGEKFGTLEPKQGYGRVMMLSFTSRPEFDVPSGLCGTVIGRGINISSGASGGKEPYTFSGVQKSKTIPWSDWLMITDDGVIKGFRPSEPRSATTATIMVTDANGSTASGTINVGEVTKQTQPEPIDFANRDPKERI